MGRITKAEHDAISERAYARAILATLQKKALVAMAKDNTGALLVAGFGWVFPTHVRNDRGAFTTEQNIDLCEKVINLLTK